MFSNTDIYAIRLMYLLALHYGEAMFSHQLSEALAVDTSYIAKVLQRLTFAGLLLSQRGRKGGFVLAKPPSDITIAHVLNAVSTTHRDGSPCPIHPKGHTAHCPLDAALYPLRSFLSSTSLAHLMPSTPSKDKSVG